MKNDRLIVLWLRYVLNVLTFCMAIRVVHIEIVKHTFSENALYSECYGPEYHGLSQIVKWFEDWHNRGQVLEWTIKRILEQNQTLIVEWYFKCDYDGMVDGFDGVTIADFDDEMKVVKLCEFQSKAEHYYPYEA